jgi:hypothetical protein
MDVASRALALLLLLPFLAAISRADKWEYFFPESVTSYSCRVAPAVMMNGRDANDQHNAYLAEAKAERTANLGTWSMTIAEEPETQKGRRRALKACAAWMDEAERRVQAAAPIRAKPKL